MTVDVINVESLQRKRVFCPVSKMGTLQPWYAITVDVIGVGHCTQKSVIT